MYLFVTKCGEDTFYYQTRFCSRHMRTGTHACDGSTPAAHVDQTSLADVLPRQDRFLATWVPVVNPPQLGVIVPLSRPRCSGHKRNFYCKKYCDNQLSAMTLPFWSIKRKTELWHRNVAWNVSILGHNVQASNSSNAQLHVIFTGVLTCLNRAVPEDWARHREISLNSAENVVTVTGWLSHKII